MTRSARPRLRARAGRRDSLRRLGLTPEAGAEDVQRAHAELLSFLQGAPEGVRRWAKEEIATADDAYRALSDPADMRAARRSSPLRRIATGTLALAVTAGVVVGVYDMGGSQGAAKPQASGTARPQGLTPSEQARVAQLMSEVKASPRDVSAMIELGNIFFEARSYSSARDWMKRAVAVEPRNSAARLPLGAAEFNTGDIAGARRDWLRVVAADPKSVEAYYDLGFLYVSREPADMADAKKMWAKVVALAPNSALAKTVATHIKSLEKK